MKDGSLLTERLAALLRSDMEVVRSLPLGSPSSLLTAAEDHRVQCLLSDVLLSREARRYISDELAHALEVRARLEQVVELVRGAELRRVVDGLCAAGVPALVFKGAALAYTLYPSPHLRPRCDTDLLIRDDDRARALEALTTMGYERFNAVDRDAIFTQWSFEKHGFGHVRHLLDLHWRISNRPLFRDVLSFDELERDAVGIPAIGPGARTPGTMHALLLACIHPVAHHHNECRLIWLYDILLMAQRLGPEDLIRFRHLAAGKQVSRICAQMFQLVLRHFGSNPRLLQFWLPESADHPPVEEPSAAYLDGKFSSRQDLILDLRAVHSAFGKARLLAAHTFPDVGYMRATYGASGALSIAVAYIRRIGGALRLLRRNGSRVERELDGGPWHV
jgi:hypothetical protein